MTNPRPDLPSWEQAMARAARHLAEIEARIAKRPSIAGVEDLAKIADAWVAYASELTNRTKP